MTTPPSGSRKSLSVLLSACLAVLSFTSTIMTVIILEKSATATLREQIGQNLAELAWQTTDKLDQGLFERFREVELLSRRRFLSDKEVDAEQAEMQLNEVQRTYPAYSWIGITDQKGIVVASTNGLIRGADVSGRPWWGNAQRGIYFGDLHSAKLLATKLPLVDGEPMRFIDVAFPYVGTDGKPAGVVGVHMSWEWAEEIERSVIEPAQKRAKVEAMIFSTDTTMLLGPRQDRDRKIRLASLAAAQAGQSGFMVEQWADGNKYLVGFSQSKPRLTSPGLGWTVLVRQNIEEAHAPVRHLQTQVLVGGIALSLVFTVFAFFAARRIAEPLRILARDASEIQHGKRERLSMPPMTYREVGDLGTAFIGLIDDLRRQETLLRDANTGLEQRVTERSAEAVRNANHLRLIADNLPVMIAYVDAHECYTFCNKAYFVRYGVTPAQMIGSTVSQLLGAEMYLVARPHIERVLQGERVVFENQHVTSAGTTYLQVTYIPDAQADGTVAGFFAMSQDITDGTNQKRRLQYDAMHDWLTGLPNRAACMEQIKGAIARSQRSGKALAVLFMDIDKFKLINDVHGHAAGDQVLIEFAARVKRCMRETDYVCRLAGDEFVVVAEGLAGVERDAILVADKILAELRMPSNIDGIAQGISSSVGIAFHIAGDIAADTMLRQADAAMYAAKRAGSGRVACFRPDLTEAPGIEGDAGALNG